MAAGTRIYVSAVSPTPGVQSVAGRHSECAALTRAPCATSVGLDELLRRALHDPLSTAA
jgi:hypothetical protein